ncbi:MAG: hypothetical protein V2A66_10780 [Pseudomonadota bacterium]
MRNVTAFDTQGRYILLQIYVEGKNGRKRDCIALLDTGAPSTEFSDEVLQHLGFLEDTNPNVQLKPGLQTQKYGQIVLPHIEACSCAMKSLAVYVSHFEKSWGIDALIGLDFFRQFRVTIDYKAGQIITESYGD